MEEVEEEAEEVEEDNREAALVTGSVLALSLSALSMAIVNVPLIVQEDQGVDQVRVEVVLGAGVEVAEEGVVDMADLLPQMLL